MKTNGEAKHGEVLPPQSVQIVHQAPRGEAADIDVLAVIEKRNEMLSRILAYAIKATHAGQWTDQGGKPYPTAAAAEVMARRCAVKISNVNTTKVPSSDDKGHFYMYVATATASLPGGYDSIEAMGTCSSRDTFLGTETRSGRPLSEIDEGNILKAAYSNMLVNAITRLLGVRSLSWEQLRELGIDSSQVAKVDFNHGSKGGGSTAHKDGVPVVKFGKDKGKPLTEVADLSWLHQKAKEDVAKNDPKWHAKNVEWLGHIDAEIARRANASAGATPVAPSASVWQRILQFGKSMGHSEAALKALVPSLTKKTKPAELKEEDFAAVKAHLEKEQREAEAF
jgi:hypothetical protein